MEKLIKPVSGYLALFLALVFLGASIYFFSQIEKGEWMMIAAGIVLMLLFILTMKGLMIVQPNDSRVLNLFGKYVGTAKDNGLFFVNPFYATQKLTLRAQNLQGQMLKVNDKM